MKISQREARILKRRVSELEREKVALYKNWLEEIPSWTSIARCSVSEIIHAKISVARLLKHAVVVSQRPNGEVVFFACNLEGK